MTEVPFALCTRRNKMSFIVCDNEGYIIPYICTEFPIMTTVFKYLKPLVLLVFLLTGAHFASFAQKDFDMYENRTFYGGLILGMNLTQIDGDNFAGYRRAGLNAGGVVYIKLQEHVAGSVEVLFSQKGSRATYAQPIGPGQYITKYGVDLNYAEMPVMINYFDSRKSHFGGGFSYSQLATANEYMNANYAIPKLSDYPFKKMDINLLLSGSLHMYKGLFFNLRFQYSILSIRDNVPGITKGAQFNNLWTLRLMYLFV